jgi:ribosomal protein L11 methyltransferase
MAFGTGTHPTTQLSLELIEAYVLAHPGTAVLDVGCGSAILSIAAKKLGSGPVLGVDIDEDSIQSAVKNLSLNQLTEKIELAVGSVGEILDGKFTIQSAPLVIANILAPILIRLLDAGLANLLTPDGRLVLSGIMDLHIEDMHSALEKHSLVIEKQVQHNDWFAFQVRQA